MRRSLVNGNTWLVLMAALLATLSAPAMTAAPMTERSEDLEEIEVRGTRLYEMREAIIAAEDRFYARYNDLNKVDEYDIVCSLQKPTGTLLSKRVCRARAVDNANGDEAQGMLQAMQDGGNSRALSAIEVLTMKEPEYEANLLKVLRDSPELQKIVRERERLQKRYDAARKDRFKGRTVLFKG